MDHIRGLVFIRMRYLDACNVRETKFFKYLFISFYI